MLVKEVAVLCYIPVIKACDAKVEQDVKEEWEAENEEIWSIAFKSDLILYGAVDTKDPERLN